MRNKRAVLLGGLGMVFLAGPAGAAVVTFDNPNDFANNFVVNTQTGTAGTGFTQVSSGGVGNTGAVDVTAGPSGTLDSTAVYTPTSFDPAAGTITISQFVKVQSTNTGDRLLHLGIIDDTSATHQLNGGGAARADFISARISPGANTAAGATTSAFNYQVQAGQSTSGAATGTTNNNATTNFDLTLGDWYLFTINITKTATVNTFSVDGSLQDFGADGLTPGATNTFAVQTIAANTTDMYNDTTVFGAFRSHAAQGGADLLDTFTITQQTPEPAALGLVGMAAVGLLSRRRRA